VPDPLTNKALPETVLIRDMTEADADDVLRIYGEGIAAGHATFQAEPPDWPAFDAGHRPAPRLVAEAKGQVLGWAALSPVSSRPVYAGVGEHSVYIAGAARGLGLGRILLQTFVEDADAAGFWTLVGAIFPENRASIALHRACGFRVVGRRKRLGKMRHGPMAGQWRDVLLMERRRPDDPE